MSQASRAAVMTDPLASCSAEELQRLGHYWTLLRELGSKHNLVAKDSLNPREKFFDVHVRHALALARRSFPDGATVVDWGTGGGIPAIPLAIVFPKVSFVGIDAVEKKVLAVRAMARRLDLDNVEVWHGRAEDWTGETDYSVSRATAPLDALWSWHLKAQRTHRIAASPNDWSQELICLKGGDLKSEIDALRKLDPAVGVSLIKLDPLSPAFEGKFVVAVSRNDP